MTTRRVGAKGTIGFATVVYKAGAWLAGQTVEVTCEGGLVQIHHRGVLDRDPRPSASPSTSRSPVSQRGRRPQPSRPVGLQRRR